MGLKTTEGLQSHKPSASARTRRRARQGTLPAQVLPAAAGQGRSAGPGARQDIPALSVSSPTGTDAGGPALLMEAEQIKQNISRLNQEVRWGPEVGACPRKPRRHRPVLTAVCPFPDQPPQPGGFSPQPGAAEHDGAAQGSPGRPAARGLSLPSACHRLAATRCPGAPLAPGAPQLAQLPHRQPSGQTLPGPQPLCPRRRPAPLAGRRGAAPAAGGRPRPSPGLGLAAAAAAAAAPLRPFLPRLLGRGRGSRPPAAAVRLHQLPLILGLPAPGDPARGGRAPGAPGTPHREHAQGF